MPTLDELRAEAKALVEGDSTSSKLAMRSCWNCNGAHEHLKQVDYVIYCFACNRYFYLGVDITESQ